MEGSKRKRHILEMIPSPMPESEIRTGFLTVRPLTQPDCDIADGQQRIADLLEERMQQYSQECDRMLAKLKVNMKQQVEQTESIKQLQERLRHLEEGTSSRITSQNKSGRLARFESCVQRRPASMP
jgi:alanyl-tRNA synthetase